MLADTKTANGLAEVSGLVRLAIAVIVLAIAGLLEVLVISATNELAAVLTAGQLTVGAKIAIRSVTRITLLRPLLIQFAIAIVVQAVAGFCFSTRKRIAKPRLALGAIHDQVCADALPAHHFAQAIVDIAIAIIVDAVA